MCGLKPKNTKTFDVNRGHTLRGCVDWNAKANGGRRWSDMSHPSWVCGLKPLYCLISASAPSHTLRGCVDWNTNASAHVDGNNRHTLRGCVDWNSTPALRLTLMSVTPFVGVWIETCKIARLSRRWLSHTLRGCVDWNKNTLLPLLILLGHTLRGCVDWNCYDVLVN